MTTQEWGSIAARMIAWWPATRWTQEMTAVWYEELAEYDAVMVLAAMERRKLEPNDFAPSVGTVRSIIDSMLHPEAPPWPEAWQRITRAMSKTRGDQLETVRMLSGEHEALAGFVQAHTVRGLGLEQTDHPEYGGAVMRRLEQSYADVVRRTTESGKMGRALETATRRAELGAGASVPRKLGMPT